MSHIGYIKRGKTAILIIDIQERLIPVIANKEEIIRNANILIEGSRILDLPLLITEQYPKGLGHTSSEINIPEDNIPMEKICFSCFLSDPVRQQLNDLEIKSVILAGAETHICVLKTALDLLHHGYEVHIAADAVGSRKVENKQLALERLRQSGAFIASTEMVLFQLLDQAGTEEFKMISKLIR